MSDSAELALSQNHGLTGIFAGSSAELQHRPAKQIPFLDGLRTIAILLVINGHFSAEFVTLHGDNWYSKLPLVLNGWIGVDLFFVLSGFFIGGQLWKELLKDHNISIRRFIVRRSLRIWPLYFFTYFIVLIAFWHNASAKEYGWADLIFVVNYFNYGIVLGGWSLSTEEQFYILAPILIYLFARNSKPQSIRLFLWAMLIAILFMRTVFWVHHAGSFLAHSPDLFRSLYYPFHTHCDGLIMGLILSNLWVNRKKGQQPRFGHSLFLVAAGLIVLVALRQIQHEVLIFTGLALFFGSLVWFGLDSGVHLFQSQPFYWISRLSFGMYLNHAYLIEPASIILGHISPFSSTSVANQLFGTVILILISAAVSLATFCLVEHPFLNLRSRLLGSSEGNTAEASLSH